MLNRPGIRDVLWMAVGAALLVILTVLVTLYSQEDKKAAARLAVKARKVDLVERMRLGLAAASEAEKSAVMAVSDQDSKTYADQARAETTKVAGERKELEELLAGGSREQKDSLDRFSKVFADFQRIDDELLALAVRNTNLKAYALAFGPAAEAIKEMDSALSRLRTKSAGWPDAMQVAVLAFGTETSALRLQTLLAPHIAEESNKRMDELEAAMATEDREVRKDLDGLAALPKLKGDSDLQAATSSYARFSDLRTQILKLSRENTNVRSLSISLKQKRNAMLVCQDALAALREAILAEPIPGVDYGRFGRPIKPR